VVRQRRRTTEGNYFQITKSKQVFSFGSELRRVLIPKIYHDEAEIYRNAHTSG
jgi:hypothetical protein